MIFVFHLFLMNNLNIFNQELKVVPFSAQIYEELEPSSLPFLKAKAEQIEK